MVRYLIIIANLLLFSCKADTVKQSSSISVDSANSSKGHIFLGRDAAKQQMKESLALHIKPFSQDSLIKDSATAVAITEPILFGVYGKE